MPYQKDILPEEQKLLHQFLSIALGSNSYLHPYIDESYRKKEWEYYEAYQKSSINGSPLFAMYTTKSEEKIRQAAAMIVWCYQNQQFVPLEQLIKKGYKFVYQYIQQHEQIDFDHFIRSFAKRQKGKLVKEIELVYQNIVLWYLCVRTNKPIKTNIAWESFQNVLRSMINDTQLEKINFSNEMCEEYREEIDGLYEKYNIPKNPQFDSLGAFLEYLIGISLKGIYEKDPSCDSEQAQQLVFQQSPAKYIGALGGWLKTLKIHEMDAMEQVLFSKEDLDIFFLELLYAEKYNHISDVEQALFFVACLYQKCTSSLYWETKQLYLDQSKQDYYVEMKWKESRIHEQEAELLQKQRQWELENNRLQTKIESLEQELRHEQAKNRKREQQIELLEDYANEVHALRSYVFRDEKENNDGEYTPSLKNMAEFIGSKRIIVFGGSSNWQKKIKELLPTAEFVEVGEKNRDISKIQRVDAVFINTAVFAHSFYKKVIKELSNSETPLYYLNGQSNVDKTILEMYKWLTE